MYANKINSQFRFHEDSEERKRTFGKGAQLLFDLDYCIFIIVGGRI